MYKAWDGRNLPAGKFGTRTALTSAMSNKDKCQCVFFQGAGIAGWLPLIHDSMLVSFSLVGGCPSGREMLRSQGKYWTSFCSHTPGTMILWGFEEEGGACSKKVYKLMKILWRGAFWMQVSVGNHLEIILNEIVIIPSVHQTRWQYCNCCFGCCEPECFTD